MTGCQVLKMYFLKMYVILLMTGCQMLKMFFLKMYVILLMTGCQVLKTLDTYGNCQRPLFSLGVSQHMHKITNLRKFELNWLSKLRDNNGRKKAHLSHKVVCFMLDFGTSKSRYTSVSNPLKITSFSKTTLLQREPFLTMFNTINSSPLLVTK